MFTGIIQEIGTITNIEEKKSFSTISIKTDKILKNQKIGSSISVNGVCTTITDISENQFKIDAIKETLELTNLSLLKENNPVNLEPALTLSQGLDGHLVSGHVDCIGTVKSFNKTEKKVQLSIIFPKKISKHLSIKGSITINGVSLTITDLQTSFFTVDLIPHTLENTNLKNLKENDQINLEIDLISRYLERLLNAKEEESKYHFLQERGFI